MKKKYQNGGNQSFSKRTGKISLDKWNEIYKSISDSANTYLWDFNEKQMKLKKAYNRLKKERDDYFKNDTFIGPKQKVIEDNMGQWTNPGKITKINSNRITMKGVNYPVVGVSDQNDIQLMQPGQEYKFKGNTVTEYPIMENAKSGIHINPKNKGKFNATKKATGKTTEELTHSKNPLTRKRAIFAQNAKKWKKGQQGLQFTMDELSPADPIETINSPQYTQYQQAQDLFTQPQQPVSTASEIYNYKSFPTYNPEPQGQKEQKIGNTLSKIPVVGKTIGGIVKGIGMIKEQKENKLMAKQNLALSKVVKKASETRPEKVKRKYVRPEDQIVDPNEMFPSYGTGTNYLAKNGKTVKAKFGDLLGGADQYSQDIGNAGQVLGSLFGGGQGQATGASTLGQSIGEGVGSLIPIPGAKAIGSLLGSAVGGMIGGNTLKQTEKYNKKANANYSQAALNQGIENTQNQYTSFMENGGNLKSYAMGGDLQTHWGGVAEEISENIHLPEEGKTVIFKGNTHNESDSKGRTGIGVTFGEKGVEVEKGEPAVKTDNGSLTVFGDMTIPEYGALEIGDKTAKGKKFKSYIKDLSLQENKQNKVIDKNLSLIDDTQVRTAFDKLKLNSGKAMITGADMRLEDIAKKKQSAAIVQNAILETAKEHNLDSGMLAKGKFKKAKSDNTAQKGKTISTYTGVTEEEGRRMLEEKRRGNMLSFDNPQIQVPEIKPVINIEPPSIKSTSVKPSLYNTIPRSEVEKYRAVGWDFVPGNNNQLTRLIPGKNGQLEIIDIAKPGGTSVGPGWESSIIDRVKRGGYDAVVQAGHILDTPQNRLKFGQYSPAKSSKPDYINIEDPTITNIPPSTPENNVPPGFYPNEPQEEKEKFPWMDLINQALPFIRPTNRLGLDPATLAGEQFALATNQLEPVNAQLYNPLLEQPFDISLQDQMNANQADFNKISKLVANNPAAQAALAGQKYQANSQVLGEQMRINQAQKAGVFARNRQTLNDAQLKNLGILDQQYVRQSQAKANTRAVAKAALESIGDKIAKNRLENKILAVDQNRYNYRFGAEGRAWNFNPLVDFDAMVDMAKQSGIVDIDDKGNVRISERVSKKYDRNNNYDGKTETKQVTKRNAKNGSILKAYKNL